MRFFTQARDKERAGSGASMLAFDKVAREEFRLLLLCMRQYLQLQLIFRPVRWGIVFLPGGINEFRDARMELKLWGVKLGAAESQIEDEAFFVLDQKGFEPFIRWVVEAGRLEVAEAEVGQKPGAEYVRSGTRIAGEWRKELEDGTAPKGRDRERRMTV